MDFSPKTKQQLLDERLVAGQECDATVAEAADETSKKGNAMIALKLRVYNKAGSTMTIRDWLVPAMGLKLLEFCESAGIKDKYDSGSVTADDCYNRDVRVMLGTRKDPTGQYDDQLTIKSYIPRDPGATKPRARAASPVSEAPQFAEADVPF